MKFCTAFLVKALKCKGSHTELWMEFGTLQLLTPIFMLVSPLQILRAPGFVAKFASSILLSTKTMWTLILK